jgi:hypothetical protein
MFLFEIKKIHIMVFGDDSLMEQNTCGGQGF